MATDTVQKVKEKLSIAEVVAPYVKLARSGKYLKGLSPFNKEKTPSFYVNEERGSYYCFSSNQGGDMFTFIETMEGVDFKGALKILAEKAGVEIVYERGAAGASREQRDRSERLREAMARAEQSYARALDEKGAAYRYALSRGLTPATIREWTLGFAPDSWRTLLEELAAAGFTIEELLAAGLIKEADGKRGTYYDRFRNRLVFPIKDSAGRTVAFTGRALTADDQAKYLNSPETDLYKKSEILYGMDKAKDAIRVRGFALLVEGQMDVLHAHQAGFTNSVALSGTALTPSHLALMKRYSENLMLALDGDRAGLAATAKHAMTALRSGMRVKAVRLPKGKDPADVITEGADGAGAKDFAKRVADAQPIVEFFLAVLSEGEPDTHRLILTAEKIVLPLIASVQSPIERGHFIEVMSRRLGLSTEEIRSSLARIPRSSETAEKTVAGTASVRAPGADASVSKRAPYELRTEELAAVRQSYPRTALAKKIESEYIRIIGAPLPEDTVPERTLFEVGLTYGENPAEDAADELIRVFEKTWLDDALREATMRMRRAETMKDKAAEEEATRAWMGISQRRSSLS